MNKKTWTILTLIGGVFLGGAVFGGCTSGEPSDKQAGAPDSSPAAKDKVAANTPPQKVVAMFLDSLRDGDHDATEALLTKKSLEETEKYNFSLQQIGTPTLKYKIGKTKTDPQNKNRVMVESTWTEDGVEENAYGVSWVLKRQTEGWRICGMSTAVVPQQPPIHFNFEDGADFHRKWNQTDEVLAHGEAENAATRQAARPEGPAIDSP